MARLGTESAFAVLAQAQAVERAGRKVVHLEIGEPDFGTPAHIVQAAKAGLEAGHTHYVPAPGTPRLREAVSAYLERNGRLRASPDRVVVTPGAKPIMFFTILAMCEKGDEVLYPNPGFPMYESIVSFSGAVPVPVPLREENGFRVDPEEVESLVTPRTKLLVLNSPHNPCGSALTKDDCEAIAEIAIRHDLTVLTDEVYWATRYDGKHTSVLDLDGMAERTVLLDGWSKPFAMTGWRLGFGVFPEDLGGTGHPPGRELGLLHLRVQPGRRHSGPRGPWQPVEDMVAEFRVRRDVIVEGLERIPGIPCATPQGAFYVFPNMKVLGHAIVAARHAPARRGWGGVRRRYGVRVMGRRLHTVLLRQLGREHPHRARVDRGVLQGT